VSTKVGTYQQPQEPVEGVVGPVAGVRAAWMPRPSPQGWGRFACEALLRKRPNAQPPAAGPVWGFTASPATGPTAPSHRNPASAVAVAGQRPALPRVRAQPGV